MPDIPTEILQEVFKQSLCSPLRTDEAGDFPWYLGHVCSEWRALFFSMRSTFWNRIQIEFCYPVVEYGYYWEDVEERYISYLHEIISFFLDCTDGAPFSFAFGMNYGYVERHYNSLGADSLLELLFGHSEQWEASIQLWASELRFLRDAKGHFPLLKKLEIRVDTNAHNKIRNVVVLDDAPLLTHVVLWDIPTWRFDWSSLTIVSFQFQNTKNYDQILATLQKTINLVELAVNDAFREDLDINAGTWNACQSVGQNS